IPMPTFEDAPADTERSAVAAQSSANPAPSPTAAWAAARPRVVWPAHRISQRPASSSPRSDRVAANRPQIAARMITNIPDLYAVYPATVSSRRSGPNSAAHAVLPSNESASRSRAAVVTATARAAPRSSYRSLCRIVAGLPPSVGAVMGEEQLFQRGLPAHEVPDARGGERGEQGFDRAGDLTTKTVALHLDGAQARDIRQVGDGAIELGFHVQRREVAHLGERAHLDQVT